MNKKRIAFGIGIVLVVLAAFTASAAATNVVYFDPDPSCVAPGETVNVELRLNSTEGVTCMEADIYFDPDVLNITDVTPGAFPNQFCWCNHGNFVAMGGVTPDWMNLPPGDYLFVTLTLEGNDTGTSALTYDRNKLWDEYFEQITDVTWLDGTFNGPCCGDANCDGVIDFDDAVAVIHHWAYGSPLCSEWAADINCDGHIDMGDGIGIRNHWYFGFDTLHCCES